MEILKKFGLKSNNCALTKEKPLDVDNLPTLAEYLRDIREKVTAVNNNQNVLDSNMKHVRSEIMEQLVNLDCSVLIKKTPSVIPFKERVKSEGVELMYLKVPAQEIPVSTNDVQEMLNLLAIVGLKYSGLSTKKVINEYEVVNIVEKTSLKEDENKRVTTFETK